MTLVYNIISNSDACVIKQIIHCLNVIKVHKDFIYPIIKGDEKVAKEKMELV